MNWLWFIGGTWLAVGIALALLIGRSIRGAAIRAEAEGREEEAAGTVAPLPPPESVAEQRSPAPRRQNSPPTVAGHSPLVRGRTTRTQRTSAEREHGLL